MARALTACIAVVLLCSAAMAQQVAVPPDNPDRVRGIVTATRFTATVSFPAEGGQARSLLLSLGKLSLSGGRRIEVPALGFYVATLVSGDVVTSIGGKETTRHTGNSWSVESGERMIVQLLGRSEDALFEVFKVQPSAPAQ